MSDPKDLEFLAAKSKEMVEKQVDSFRSKQSNAGTIIGVTALFIPFFLTGLENAYPLIEYLSIIPVLLFICSMVIMLWVLRTKLLYQFFHVKKYKELVNKDYTEILLFEIGANNDSYTDNKPLNDRLTKRFNFGITITTIAIIISVGLLLANKFYKPETPPTKVQIITSTK